MRPPRALLLALLLPALAACGSGSSGAANTTSPTAAATTAPTEIPGPTAVPLVRHDIQATRLTIPALNIDAPVTPSRTVPDTTQAPPGCPPRPPDQDTLTVPNEGIATPSDDLEGFENKAWIFGHSRYLGKAGIFFSLQEIYKGDELFIDGIDRQTGEKVTHQRYVVDSIYLADTFSGDKLITADGPTAIPPQPMVILQTSVREDGAGKQWILNQQKLLSKAQNVVEGDLNDPCKYLLLFIFAKPA